MSARDDYPKLTRSVEIGMASWYEGEIDKALDEIDELRTENQALTDQVFDLADELDQAGQPVRAARYTAHTTDRPL